MGEYEAWFHTKPLYQHSKWSTLEFINTHETVIIIFNGIPSLQHMQTHKHIPFTDLVALVEVTGNRVFVYLN